MFRVERTHRVAVAVSSFALVAAGVLVGPASAAADSTPPVITTDRNAGFVVGSTIGESDLRDNNSGDDAALVNDWTSDISQVVKWKVTDNSGAICHFDIARATVSQSNTVMYSSTARRSTPFSGQQIDPDSTEWTNDLGGGSDLIQTGWILTARDCTGNATSVVIYHYLDLRVTQEDNKVAFSYANDPGGRFTYTGTWGVVNCACASGGNMRRTTAKNASTTFTGTYERDDHFGLVMAKGPARGKADVYVDGVKRATIDTYATVNTNRVVMFDQKMTAGQHTVKIVNLATAGRPRIDIDAALTN